MSQLLDLSELSVTEIATRVSTGDLAPGAAADAALLKIEEHQDKINAFVHWDLESAKGFIGKQVEVLKGRISSSNEALPLAGVPIALKDNICSIDWKTTACSGILEGFKSPYDATVVTKLKKAGAIIVGKVGMDEFAMGSSNETSVNGSIKNPWDVSRVPGGSSGGSAAAVASGMVKVALGSDTGGSIRQPASFCGVVGLKPTYGTVSRNGLLAFGSSLDQIGPIAENVEDAKIVYEVMSGFDSLDSTSIKNASPLGCSFKDLTGLKFGVLEEYQVDGIDPEVSASFEKALQTLAENGAEIVPVSIPSAEYTVPIYYVLACAEASSNLSRYDGIRYGRRVETENSTLEDLYLSSRREGFGTEVKKRIMLGTYVLSAGYKDAYYEKACMGREMLKKEYDSIFDKVDILISPTSPTPAFRLGEKIRDSLSMYLSDVFTILNNLVEGPAISVPCGFSSEGLPIGLQFSAPRFSEKLLFHSASSYEQISGITKRSRKPAL